MGEKNRSRESSKIEPELSGRFLQQIVQNMRDGMVVYDADLRCQVWNLYMEELTGKRGDDVINLRAEEIAPFLKDVGVVDQLKQALLGNPQQSVEYPFNIDETGHRGWLIVKASPLYDTKGEIIGVIDIVRDITEHKTINALLRQRTDHLENAQTIAKLGSWQLNPYTQVGVWSKEMYRLFNCDESKGPPKLDEFMQFVSPEDRQNFIDCHSKLLQTHTPFEIEFSTNPEHGPVRVMLIHARSVEGKQGELVSFAGTTQDITEIKRAKEEIVSLSKFPLENPNPVFRLNKDGEVLYQNPASKRLLKQYLNESANHIIEWAEEALSKKHVLRTECLSDGRSYSLAFTPIPESDYVNVYGLEITERKQAEEEKKHMQAQLEQAHKMESIGRLAGGVAHDFNNMLAVILGNTEFALQRVTQDQLVYGDLMEIQGAAKRSADLTRQLLAFARKQTVSPKQLDLNDTISNMLKMLQRTIGEDIKLEWIPTSGIWSIKIDPSQADQILASLCVNSRDAISGVGKITIETSNVVLDEAFCSGHAGALAGEYVKLAVTDDGCGMEKEIADNIFEPFFTTKGVGEGTGLGLATVYGIVKQNGGFIYLFSEPGKGATFTIYFLRYLDAVERSSFLESIEEAQLGVETILLVEDELAILNLNKRILESLGYRVLAAATPGEAIQLAEKNAGNIHLLMTDVIMPEMDGHELAKKLLSLYPDIKRLFVSGYTANVIAHRGILEEGVNFLQKPFSIPDLSKKLRDILEVGE